MVGVYIGIGSNLGNPIAQVQQALIDLRTIPGTSLERHSSLYWSHPMGELLQPKYINAVALLNSTLGPLELLTHLQQIET